jgi:peptidoglycan biosynthesis protein MviN/MurJ (putative lipid II flippase)
MDRPDLDFRVNGVFIGLNIVLNLFLIPLIGWVGAAVATVLSSLLSMIYAYYVVDQIVRVNLPYQEIGKQFLASILMSAVVLILKHVEVRYSVLDSNFATVMSLVFVGAITYITFLVFVSEDTRHTVVRNLDI